MHQLAISSRISLRCKKSSRCLWIWCLADFRIFRFEPKRSLWMSMVFHSETSFEELRFAASGSSKKHLRLASSCCPSPRWLGPCRARTIRPRRWSCRPGTLRDKRCTTAWLTSSSPPQENGKGLNMLLSRKNIRTDPIWPRF